MILAAYLENASDRMMVFDFSVPAKLLNNIKLPDIGTVIGWHGKHDSDEFFFKFSSFTDPGSSYRVDMNSFDVECI